MAGNPYHDKRGRFTTASGAASVTGPGAPVYGRGRQRGTGKQERIQKWTAAEKAEPRRVPRAIDTAKWLGQKVIPTGKETLLYHRTRSSSAEAIVKDRKWISCAREFSGRRGYSWFSKGGPTQSSGFYGGALLTVKVPRRAVQDVGYNNQDGVAFVQVKNSVLKGRKVRRVQ